MKTPKVYYISQGKTPEAHLQQIKKMAVSGADWIQLRLKNQPKTLVLKTAWEAAKICKKHHVIFIVNDYPEIAKVVNADGVHLGKKDASPLTARALLGNQKIIGGTANTLKDCKKLVAAGVNYIGLGPFRFTTTKKELSPVLGQKGFQHILKDLLTKTPIIAIGGITIYDSDDLSKLGVSGVALSSFLHQQENPEKTIQQIKKQFTKPYHAQF